MDYKRFPIIARLCLILSTMFLVVYTHLNTSFIIAPLFLLVGLIGQVFELLFYLERATKNVDQFLEAIKFRDFTKTYSIKGKKNSGNASLNQKFNEIIQVYQTLKLENEATSLYLQSVIEHVQVGILCIGKNDHISLLNQSAKKLLDLPFLVNFDGLKTCHPDIHQAVQGLNSGEQMVLKQQRHAELIHLGISVTEFQLNSEPYKLASIQNITAEVQETEFRSWKKLIRVLTHEIMNSVTPMLSLSKVSKQLLMDENGARRHFSELTDEDAEDIYESLHLIEKRGNGLLNFVDAYKNVTHLPVPKFESIDIMILLQDILTLFKPKFEENQIEIKLQFEHQTEFLMLDPKLIEQVLINIFTNAIYAVKDSMSPQIVIKTEGPHPFKLDISDNGKGISQNIRDQIFIPFFTTKKEGSGIGLSLSKEIMSLHRGNILVTSSENNGCCFTLLF